MLKHQFEIAALITLEVGKNRAESIAEVAESIDLIQYYCRQLEAHHGYELPLSANGVERSKTVLKPFGVFAVVSPFNFPLALAAGMVAAALLGGNTVVFKPSSDTPGTGLRLYELLQRAGLPIGVFNFVTGSGNEVGREFVENPGIDGLAFTGSREIGLEILRGFNEEGPRPCIVEMGGKNPCLIMPTANLEDAAEGVARAAFGLGGQKCSACSRVYVHQSIGKRFVEALVERAKTLTVGDPAERATFLGPLINAAAVEKFQRAVKLGKKDGRLLQGGSQVRDLKNGFYVEPTVLRDVRNGSKWFDEEFFAPVIAVNDVKSLDEGLTLANSSRFGLTAGIFTQIEEEQREFFTRIEAGVAYCNRRGGATTGAWPGVQSFGGWKHSGSTGKGALGPYYLTQFMREQSQTIMLRPSDSERR